jgi:methionyl-tRNA formyltransferase
MRIVALGRTRMLYKSIVNLKQQGHIIVLIVTGKEENEYTCGSEDFNYLSKEIGCECIVIEEINKSELIDIIRKTNPDVAISINWKTIIREDLINIFPNGIINAHAGDLPRYRGNAVPNWAVISGESEIVATLHQMDTGLDSGPILLKRHFPISESTHIGSIYTFLEENIPEMFVEVIERIHNNSISPQKQPDNPVKTLRCYPRMQRDSEIDWSLPAQQIHRLIRAVSEPFSGAYTYIDSEKLIVWKARYEKPLFQYLGVPGQVAHRDLTTGEVKVITGEGFLILKEVEIDGTNTRKKPIEIIQTIRTRLGMDLTGQISILKKRIDALEGKDKCKEKI